MNPLSVTSRADQTDFLLLVDPGGNSARLPNGASGETFFTKLWPKPVRSQVTTSLPLREAFSAALCPSLNEVMLPNSDKTAATVAYALISLSSVSLCFFFAFFCGF